MIIDCDTCAVAGTACGDCVISFLAAGVRPDRRVGTHRPLDLVPVEARALGALARAGLVPPLRHRDVG